MDQPPHISPEWKWLILAGFFGSVVRVLIRPEKSWKRWAVQVVIGVVAAVFLGGVVAHVIVSVLGEDAFKPAYLASGFLIGTGAERAIEKLQNKFLD